MTTLASGLNYEDQGITSCIRAVDGVALQVSVRLGKPETFAQTPLLLPANYFHRLCAVTLRLRAFPPLFCPC